MQGVEHRGDERERLAVADREPVEGEHGEAGHREETAPHVTRVIRVRSRTAANSGVATTYMPVMKPETLAGVCARPAVCRIWPKP